MSAPRRKIDRRLLGTWKSDARRTFKDWIFPPELSEKKRKRFKKLFGKLTLHYTPSRIISDYRGERQIKHYEVLGKDSGSVAILSWSSDRRTAEIDHIRFQGQHYWILTIAGQMEFFKRVRR